jgi:hypothetical protein
VSITHKFILLAIVIILRIFVPTVNAQDDYIQNVGERWSPDGSKIIFSSNRTGDYDIWVMDADGANQVNLTPEMPNDQFGGWSPNGEYILFESVINYSDQSLWLMQANGEGLRRVTLEGQTNIGSVAWSPDSKWIAYKVNPYENPTLWVFGVDEATPYQVEADLSDAGQIIWFANDLVEKITFGKVIIPINEDYSLIAMEEPQYIEFCPSTNLYLLSAYGGNGFYIYSLPDSILNYSYHIGRNLYDATLLCTYDARVAFITREHEIHYLKVFDSSTGDVKTLLPQEDNDSWTDAHYNPQWSPDGTQILLEWGADRYSGSDIWLINADGTNIRNLTCDNSDYACVR